MHAVFNFSKLMNMACSCNASRIETFNKKEFNVIEKKLGKCKFCIRASFLGMVISIGALEYIKLFLALNDIFYFLNALVAIGFTTLSLLHIIFYTKNKYN
jgi:hypothetical protein